MPSTKFREIQPNKSKAWVFREAGSVHPYVIRIDNLEQAKDALFKAYPDFKLMNAKHNTLDDEMDWVKRLARKMKPGEVKLLSGSVKPSLSRS